MADTVKKVSLECASDLDASRFAYISDGAYTPDEVACMTNTIAKIIPDNVKCAPNAKNFLRSFWYRAVMSKLLSADEMHIYTVAR